MPFAAWLVGRMLALSQPGDNCGIGGGWAACGRIQPRPAPEKLRWTEGEEEIIARTLALADRQT